MDSEEHPSSRRQGRFDGTKNTSRTKYCIFVLCCLPKTFLRVRDQESDASWNLGRNPQSWGSKSTCLTCMTGILRSGSRTKRFSQLKLFSAGKCLMLCPASQEPRLGPDRLSRGVVQMRAVGKLSLAGSRGHLVDDHVRPRLLEC